VSVERLAGPVVTDEAVEFELVEPALRGVALLHEMRRPRRVEFERADGAWRLTFPRPEGTDRLEYLLELQYRTGRVTVAADLTNPLRAPGPFGNKSVIEFPGCARWTSRRCG
jgi:enterochelin esterase family protein